MPKSLLTILKAGVLTQPGVCPDLPADANGLPAVTGQPCEGAACGRCAESCPTQAITVVDRIFSLDRGRCIGCSACLEVCPTGTLVRDRSTAVAVRTRTELVLSNNPEPAREDQPISPPFLRSLNVREVSTGDSASDQEAIASTNSIFDVARYGIHFVASPRYADALLVSGPAGRAMHDPLRRCYEAMAEPKLVIALGASAISGGVFSGGYAEANGVDSILPVDCYIPGDPPHPWSIIHGLLLAMGRL